MPVKHKQSCLVETQQQLNELCSDIEHQAITAMDTEFVRTQTYFARLCLIQIATESRLCCIDILAEIDTTRFREILFRGKSLKILHAAKQDLEALYTTWGHLPETIIDTQIAAGLLGYPPQIGYAPLVEDLLDIRLDKGQTRTDWSQRPLTDAQTAYAIDDVIYLNEMYAILHERLEALGRYSWALEDSRYLTHPGLYESTPEVAWQRLPGVAYMAVPMQARARKLATWREKQARKLDRPRQWILADKFLLEIAAANPHDQSQLSKVPDLPAGIARKQGRALLEVLRQANDDVQHERVEFKRQVKPAPPDAKVLKQLSHVVRDAAAALGISAELLAPRRELTAIVRGDRDVRQFRGWRKTVIGDRLLELI